MKLINKSSVYFVAITLVSGLATSSAMNSTSIPETMNSQVATVKAHFHATATPIVTTIGNRNQRRRAKRGAKKGAKKGSYNKFTKKFNCTKETTPLEHGGSKVTKKCTHQFYLGHNDIQTANGGGRTTKRPTWSPSAMPSDMPSLLPSDLPSTVPSTMPSDIPLATPTF